MTLPFTCLFVLSALLPLASPLSDNCVQYEPTNFENCLICSDSYYLDFGKCFPCPQTSNNIQICQTIASPATSQVSTISQTPSSSTLTTQSQTATLNPQTSAQNRDINSNTALRQMLLLKNFLPDHCNGFAFTSLGITCTVCQQGFLLTPSNTCSPIPTPSAPSTPSSSLTSQNMQQSGSLATNTLPSIISRPITTTNILKANCNNIKNNLCTSCYPRYYLLQGNCLPVNRLCKTYNNISGYCISCYKGYTLTDGNCSQSVTNSISDPCLTVNSDGSCQQCLSGYNLYNGEVCQVGDVCVQFDSINGDCKVCYASYKLLDGKCVQDHNN